MTASQKLWLIRNAYLYAVKRKRPSKALFRAYVLQRAECVKKGLKYGN